MENRLKEAKDGNVTAKAEHEKAKEAYSTWAEDWADEHGTAPKPEDRLDNFSVVFLCILSLAGLQ